MFRAQIHLYALAVLCVCMITSTTVNSQEPNNGTTSEAPSINSSTDHDQFTGAATQKPDPSSDPLNVMATQLPSSNETTPIFQDIPGSKDNITSHTKRPLNGPTDAVNEESNATSIPLLPKTPDRTLTSPTDPSSSGEIATGILILIIILALSAALAVLSYILWKKGRRYSFDLTNTDHDTPLRSMEHGGFIDQTKVAELPTNSEEEPSETKAVGNGCAGDKPEQTPSSPVWNIPEENSFSSESSLSLDVKKVGFNLDLDLIGDSILANGASSEPKDQKQNKNNSNDSNTGDDPVDFFTEINLDEPQ